MLRCPECHKFGVERDPYTGIERCIWQDCLWINHDDIDVEAVKHPIRFKEFNKSIRRKK